MLQFFVRRVESRNIMKYIEYNFQGFANNKYIVKATSSYDRRIIHSLEEGNTLEEAKNNDKSKLDFIIQNIKDETVVYTIEK